jgi:hypothetical protein
MALSVGCLLLGLIFDLTGSPAHNLPAVAARGVGILAVVVALLIAGAGFGKLRPNSKSHAHQHSRPALRSKETDVQESDRSRYTLRDEIGEGAR